MDIIHYSGRVGEKCIPGSRVAVFDHSISNVPGPKLVDNPEMNEQWLGEVPQEVRQGNLDSHSLGSLQFRKCQCGLS